MTLSVERLARFSDHASMLKKLRERVPDQDDRAALLWEGARRGLLHVASGSALTLLSRTSAPFDAADLLAALAPGPLEPRWSEPDWWRHYNLHQPFKSITALVARLEDAGALIQGLDQLDGLLRCAVEVGLAAEGFEVEVSEAARAGFLSWSLFMSFPDMVEALGARAFGESWLIDQVMQLPHIPWVDADIPWRSVSRPERFLAVWADLPPEGAIALASRGYWDELATPVELLGQREDLSEAALREAAEEWLARRGATGASYGGYGALALYLSLARRGLLEERYYSLMDTSMYGNADVPLLLEGLGALPLEERERRALRFTNISWLHVLSAPTERVIAETVTKLRAMKKRDRDVYALKRVRDGLRGLGPAAAPHLIEALESGPAAPFDDLLLEALGDYGLPEAGPVLAAALARKSTRAAAAEALVKLGEAVALPLLEVELFARKKDARIGAALALSMLPASPERAALAARRLEKERAKEVVDLLQPLS